MTASQRLTVERRARLDAPIETVWRLVGDFGALGQWMSAVSRVDVDREGVGAVRRCETVSGIFEERLVEVGPFRCGYEILSGPLPVRHYRATLEAHRPSPTSCEIVWSSRFDPADGTTDEAACAAVSAVYRAGLRALARRFGSAAEPAGSSGPLGRVG